MPIRPYEAEDAAAVVAIQNAALPGYNESPAQFDAFLQEAFEHGGRAWIVADDRPFGFAAAIPVPGLPKLADLNLFIEPQRQGQGQGTKLLDFLVQALAPSRFEELTYQVDQLDEPPARFLLQRGFRLSHQEWLLELDELNRLDRASNPANLAIATLPFAEASRTFSSLYRRGFAGLPWSQPFSVEEVKSLLAAADDLLFLSAGNELIGFAWLHQEPGRLGRIEPLGVVPASQGKGYGRWLLVAALTELAERGMQRAQIGAWKSNRRAIGLYQSIGFKHRHTVSYLSREV